MVTKNKSVSPTKQASINQAEHVEVDDMISTIAGARAGPYNKPSLSIANSLNRIMDILLRKEKDGDKGSNEASSNKTDANGKPINESDFFIPTTVPEGTFIPTRNGTEPLQKGDTLYLDSIKTNRGWYHKFWRIQNANRKKE